MTTYFGSCDAAGNADTSDTEEFLSFGNWTIWNTTEIYTCPGSGSFDITSLAAYCKSAGGGGNSIRMAIYSTDGATKYAEHSAATALGAGETSLAWKGDAAGITQYAPLTGGVNYLIVCWNSGADILQSVPHTQSGIYRYDASAADYSAGLPSTWSPASGSAGSNPYQLRAGVDAAASGGQEYTRSGSDGMMFVDSRTAVKTSPPPSEPYEQFVHVRVA